MSVLIRIACFLTILTFSCKGLTPDGGKVIVVQPFEDFSPEKAKLIYTAIKEVNPNTFLRRSLPLPLMAWYPARDRYRADSLIRYLGRFGGADTICLSCKRFLNNRGWRL